MCGRLQVSDFSLARFCTGGESVPGRGSGSGTPAYMSPEQLQGTLTMASDVFSFGILLWEMATAATPHGGMSRGEPGGQGSRGLQGGCLLPEARAAGAAGCWWGFLAVALRLAGPPGSARP